MRQRRLAESRLNRALGELLGTGQGRDEAMTAIDGVEEVLRALAGLIGRLG